jgi:hypothetical protein
MPEDLKLASESTRSPAMRKTELPADRKMEANGGSHAPARSEKRHFVGIKMVQVLSEHDRGTTLDYVALTQSEASKLAEEIQSLLLKYPVVTEAIQALKA